MRQSFEKWCERHPIAVAVNGLGLFLTVIILARILPEHL